MLRQAPIIAVALLQVLRCAAIEGRVETDDGWFTITNGSDDAIEELVYSLRNHPPDNKWNILRGYNIFIGNPNSRQYNIDPGFSRAIFRTDIKTSGYNMFPTEACDVTMKTTSIRTEEEYRKSMSNKISQQADFVVASFGASAEFQNTVGGLKSHMKVIMLKEAVCAQTEEYLVLHDPPMFSHSFINAIKSTNFSDESQIHNIFDEYGTHYATQMVTGSRFTVEYTMDANEFNNMEKNAKSFGLNFGAADPVTGIGTSFGFSHDDSKFKSNHTATLVEKTRIISYGSRPTITADVVEWASEKDLKPLPILTKLDTLANVFKRRFFEKSGMDNFPYTIARKKVEKALESYCNGRRVRWGMSDCTSDISVAYPSEELQLIVLTNMQTYHQQRPAVYHVSEYDVVGDTVLFLSGSYDYNQIFGIDVKSSRASMSVAIPRKEKERVPIPQHRFSYWTFDCMDGYRKIGGVIITYENEDEEYLNRHVPHFGCVHSRYLEPGIQGRRIGYITDEERVASLDLVAVNDIRGNRLKFDLNTAYSRLFSKPFYFIREQSFKKTVLNINGLSIARPDTVLSLTLDSVNHFQHGLVHGEVSWMESQFCYNPNRCITIHRDAPHVYDTFDLGSIYFIDEVVLVHYCGGDRNQNLNGVMVAGHTEKNIDRDQFLLGAWLPDPSDLKATEAPGHRIVIRGYNRKARYIFVFGKVGFRPQYCNIEVKGFLKESDIPTSPTEVKNPLLEWIGIEDIACDSDIGITYWKQHHEIRRLDSSGCLLGRSYSQLNLTIESARVDVVTILPLDALRIGIPQVLTSNTTLKGNGKYKDVYVEVSVCDDDTCTMCGSIQMMLLEPEWHGVKCVGASGNLVRITQADPSREMIEICSIRVSGYKIDPDVGQNSKSTY